MVKRAAFTFIELIFAIVIIAISVVSLPMMNQAITKGIDANLVQEAIFAAATELNEVTTAHWDDNSMETGKSFYARVININGACNATTHLRPGHINQPLHRRCLDDNTTAPADANTSGVVSLDDMAHANRKIFINDASSATGYKKKYYSSVAVTRTDELKYITITLKNADDKNITRLKAYSANIGEIDFYKRRY